MKIFDPQLTGSIEIENSISGSVTILDGLTVSGSSYISGSLSIAGDTEVTISSSLRAEYLGVWDTEYVGYLISSGDFGDTGTDLSVAAGTGKNLRFYTNNHNTESMRITTGGDVGIGVTPSYKLDVNGTGRFSSSVTATGLSLITAGSTSALIQGTGTTAYSSLSFQNTTTGYGYDIGFGGSGSIAPNSFYIYGGSSASVKVAVDSGGNVGIGTGLPSTKLQILKDTNTNGTSIEENNMAFTVLSATGQSKIAIGACNAGEYGYIQVMQDANSWSNRSLLLQPRGGNVLIGTYTNSTYKLDVNGNARFSSIDTTSLVTANGLFTSGYDPSETFLVIKSTYDSTTYKIGCGKVNVAYGGLAISNVTSANNMLYFSPTGAATFSGNVSAANLSAANLLSGTYNPTASSLANFTTVTPHSAQYQRVGNVVTVSGAIDIYPSGTGGSSFNLSLPITTAFINTHQAGGSGCTNVVYEPCFIRSVTSSAVVEFGMSITYNSGHTLYYSFTYQVI